MLWKTSIYQDTRPKCCFWRGRTRWIFDVRWNMKFPGCTLFRKLNIMPRFRAQVASFSEATCDWRFDISLRLHLSFLFFRIVSKTHDVSQFHARFNWFSLRYAGLRFFFKNIATAELDLRYARLFLVSTFGRMS